jgi:hypothetical protein
MYPQELVTRCIGKLEKTTMSLKRRSEGTGGSCDKAGVDSLDVNLLFLSDRLRDCYSNHLRLR